MGCLLELAYNCNNCGIGIKECNAFKIHIGCAHEDLDFKVTVVVTIVDKELTRKFSWIAHTGKYNEGSENPIGQGFKSRLIVVNFLVLLSIL